MTLADFYRRVAEDIGIVGAEQRFEAVDELLITNIYTDVYYELEAQGIVDWGVSADLPNKYVGSLVDLVGARVAPKFHVPPRNGVDWDSRFGLAENRLRFLQAKRYNPSTTKATYY